MTISIKRSALGLLIVGLLAVPRLLSAGANRWTQRGPDGGMVSSIAIDPVASDTAYAVAADGGGLFKTVDGGADWSRLVLPLDGMGTPVRPSAVVVDPFFPRNVWSFTDSEGFRSRNSGDTWTASSVDGSPFFTIAFSPVRPSLAFAATGSGAWKTVDGGDHWTITGLTASVGLFCLDAFDESLMLAVEYGATPVGAPYSIAYRSEDGGASWTDIRVQGGSGLGLVDAIVADPRHSATFFAAAGGSIMKSVDGGKSWSPTAQLPQDVGYADLLVWDGPLLLAGSRSGHFVSTANGGGSWSAWSPVPVGTVGALVFDPHDAAVGFCGSAGDAGYSNPLVPAGIYKTIDGGAAWSRTDSGFRGTRFRVLAVDPSDFRVVYGTLEDESPERLLMSSDAGAHWSATGLSGGITFGNIAAMAIDPASPATLYVSTAIGLMKSTDRGDSWAPTGLTSQPFQVAIDPDDGARLYAVGDSGLEGSDDGGDHWRAIEPSAGALVQTIAIDPADSDVLYATVRLDSEHTAVLKTGDRGESWHQLWETYLTFDPLLVDPSTPSIVYADTSNGFFRSTDAGATWSEFNGDLTAGAWLLSIDPAHNGVLYARNAEGPIRSIDGGYHWQSWNQGLDLSDRMTSFVMDRSGQHLYVGTYGGGLYAFDFSASRSVVPAKPLLPIGVGGRE